MNKRTWIVGALVAAAVIGGGFMLLPPAQRIAGDDTQLAPETESRSQIEIGDARVLLPAVAGRPAEVHFSVTNHGERSAFIRDIRVQHARRVGMFDTPGPAVTPVENIDIAPGQTLRFARDSYYLVATDYDENVIPGATLRLTLTLGNGETRSTNARVESSLPPQP